jgi:hypothetical protein
MDQNVQEFILSKKTNKSLYHNINFEPMHLYMDKSLAKIRNLSKKNEINLEEIDNFVIVIFNDKKITDK